MELLVSVCRTLGSFSLEADFVVRGDRIGVYGPSGSGKSTLVNVIAGLVKPDRGTIRLDDTVLFESSLRRNLSPERRHVGIVFQHPHLFPHLSVRGNLLYGYRRCSRGRRSIDLSSLVEVLQLDHLLDRGVNNLSGGERQRVAIGRAVLSNPSLLLLDEPLSALDEKLKFQIMGYLKAVCSTFGIPYLFISHSLLEMRLMTDALLTVSAGRIVEQTTAEQVARSRMGQSPVGYINILSLERAHRSGGLYAYGWGGGHLLISAGSDAPVSLFELSSKDIILFRKHPEAISARNLLRCRVAGVFSAGGMTGIELECGGGHLVSEVVNEAAEELSIREGAEVFAAIKASAFRRLK